MHKYLFVHFSWEKQAKSLQAQLSRHIWEVFIPLSSEKWNLTYVTDQAENLAASEMLLIRASSNPKKNIYWGMTKWE